MSELVITHQNFKQNRSAYCITLREIANRAGVSVSTVDNYEKFDSSYIRTRSRDDNAMRIEKALKELIDEKVIGLFTGGKKEEKVVEESNNREVCQSLKNAFDREYVANKIKKYCNDNQIIISEFMEMCGLHNNVFSPSTIKRNPWLYPRTISKIIKATGWTLDMFKEDKNVPFSIEKKEQSPSKLVNDLEDKTEIKDRKFIFENGRYYEMHVEVITKTVLKEISKEDFIAAIG